MCKEEPREMEQIDMETSAFWKTLEAWWIKRKHWFSASPVSFPASKTICRDSNNVLEAV